jgi:hypothetical protein
MRSAFFWRSSRPVRCRITLAAAPHGGRVAGRNRSLARESPSGCPGLTIGGWCRIHGWLGFEAWAGGDPKNLVADAAKTSFACHVSQKGIYDIFATYVHQSEL